jgi:DNA polymerase-3 subunit gamma/tau
VSYQVFARKYRPKTFKDVLGQDHIVRTLENAISQERLAHAYLFVGPRGTGKTSTARIFAKALNCTNGPSVEFDPDEELCREIAEGRCLDVLEIDGASNNGVDQVRELRDNVKFAPARCRYKIYYIDEVHMLSTAAFNALLKTLEEPPEHVKFIFATTEANKILPTIISRCQRFDLRRIPAQTIAKHLLDIARMENVRLDEKAAFAIAKGADGGMRDAQSMLDQLVAFCGDHIEERNVLEIFGFAAAETVSDLAGQLLSGDTVGALRAVHTQSEAGKDLGVLLSDLIQHVRTLLVHQSDPEAAVEDLSPEIAAAVAQQSAQAGTAALLRMVDGLAEVDARMRWSSNKRLHLELGIIQAVQHLNELTLDDVIGALENGPPLPAAERPVRAAAPVVARAAAPAKPETPAPAPVQAPTPVETEPPPPVQAAPVRKTPAPAAREEPPAPAPRKAARPPAETRPVAGDAGGLLLDIAEVPSSPAPARALSKEEFWGEMLRLVDKRRRLTSHWLQLATCVELGADSVVLGFPTGQQAARDNLERPATRDFLEAAAVEILGRRVKIRFVMDSSLALPDPDAVKRILEEGEAGEESDSAAIEAAPRAEEPVAPAESSPEAEPEQFDDPLIKEALEIFRLRKLVPKG